MKRRGIPIHRLARALGVHPGEETTTALLLGLLLFLNAGNSIGSSAIQALFFARFGVRFLPIMFVLLGIVTFVSTMGMTVLISRIAPVRAYVGLPLVVAALLLVERGFVVLDPSWLYPVLWLSMNVFVTLVGIASWGLAGAVYDTRQAKRLFPVVTAGGILGAVVGGLATQPLAHALHAENLLLVWAGGTALVFGLSGRLARRVAAAPSHSLPSASRPRAGTPRQRSRLVDDLEQGYQFVRRSPLMVWISLAVITYAILVYLLAFPFSAAATEQFPQADALAAFLGIFQGVATAVSFLTSLFLGNRVFARFGIMAVLIVFSALHVLGFGALAVYAAFPALVTFRLVQLALVNGIAGTAFQATFNVVPPNRRETTRAFVNGVPLQVGVVIAGLLLLVGATALPAQELYVIGLVVAVVSTYFGWKGSRAYRGALVAALHAGQPEVFVGEENPFGELQGDPAALVIATAGATSPSVAVRRTSVEILGYLATSDTGDILVGALGDPDPPVRAAALRALARAGVSAALVDVMARLDDSDADVRCLAAEALGKLTRHSPNVARLLRPLLRDRDSAVQAQAAVVLLRIGTDADAWDLLTTMAVGSDSERRLIAFDALCELGNADGFDVVAAGLTEAAPPIRREAAAALARLDSRRALPLLVGALRDEDRLVRESVARALQLIGQAAVETVAKSLFDPAAAAGALRALELLPTAGVAPTIRDYAGAQATLALAYLDRWRGLAPAGEDPPGRLLADSLGQRTRHHATNALKAVGAIGDVSAMALILRNLASADPRQRANALETLDSFGERTIVRPLLAVWESVEAKSTARADRGRRLVEVLADEDSWLRACGALVAGNSDDSEVQAGLDRLATSDSDALVRDTAMAARRGGISMAGYSTLSLMERVLFLRQVPLFADLAPSDLKQVAAVAAEEVFGDGEVLATQGESGDELFVIVSGSVQVLASGRAGQSVELARVGSGSYVGEMAILTGEPHMASLVAVGSLRVLTIDQKQFESILRDRPETSLAVIRVLCARLRDAEVGTNRNVE